MFRNPRDGFRKISISELMMLIASVIAFIGTAVAKTAVKTNGTGADETDPAVFGALVPDITLPGNAKKTPE